MKATPLPFYSWRDTSTEYRFRMVNRVEQFGPDNPYGVPEGRHMVIGTISTGLSGSDTIISYLIDHEEPIGFTMYNLR